MHHPCTYTLVLTPLSQHQQNVCLMKCLMRFLALMTNFLWWAETGHVCIMGFIAAPLFHISLQLMTICIVD